MNPLLKAAKEAFAFIEAQGWQACLIGGMAAVRWGRPRATQDVDISLFTGLGDEERYVDPLLDSNHVGKMRDNLLCTTEFC